MTEEEARLHAEGIAHGMGIKVYVIRSHEGDYLLAQTVIGRLRNRRKDRPTCSQERVRPRVGQGRSLRRARARRIAGSRTGFERVGRPFLRCRRLGPAVGANALTKPVEQRRSCP